MFAVQIGHHSLELYMKTCWISHTEALYSMRCSTLFTFKEKKRKGWMYGTKKKEMVV